MSLEKASWSRGGQAKVLDELARLLEECADLRGLVIVAELPDQSARLMCGCDTPASMISLLKSGLAAAIEATVGREEAERLPAAPDDLPERSAVTLGDGISTMVSAWASFESDLLRGSMPAQFRKQMRRAFYAGAIDTLTSGMDDNDLPAVPHEVNRSFTKN